MFERLYPIRYRSIPGNDAILASTPEERSKVVHVPNYSWVHMVTSTVSRENAELPAPAADAAAGGGDATPQAGGVAAPLGPVQEGRGHRAAVP